MGSAGATSCGAAVLGSGATLGAVVAAELPVPLSDAGARVLAIATTSTTAIAQTHHFLNQGFLPVPGVRASTFEVVAEEAVTAAAGA
jgi:hypothetical protein